jgi:hypothetical protein
MSESRAEIDGLVAVGKAIEMIDRANRWRDFEGWGISETEREIRMQSDAQLAQAHATLAVVAVLSEIRDKLEQVVEALPMAGRGI